MARLYADTEKILTSSQKIADITSNLNRIQSDLANIHPANIASGSTRNLIEQTLKNAADSVLDEASHMKTMGDALALIAQSYQNTEKAILGSIDSISAGLKTVSSESSTSGTDKRKWYQNSCTHYKWITI